MTDPTDPRREFLRHTLATLAYRGGKTLRAAPPGFATQASEAGGRTPIEILSHIGDLLEWTLHLADGRHVWVEHHSTSWSEAVGRFFELLEQVDARLAGPEPLQASAESLFQGPVADALTHVGQLALLRRRAGSPVKGENYFKAEIVAGRVGPGQASPRREF
jgi:hypothetical protein